ncbi:Endonuclease/exonuclease/phosphatase, partial [Circinella umbellata]
MNRSFNLKFLSLNCNGLIKTTNKSTAESNFIKHLKQQKPHLIAIQESHAHTEQIQSSLNFQFQTTSSIWTKHCGIVSMSPEIILSVVSITADQRVILAKVTHTSHYFDPLYIMVLYAPANGKSPRYRFYSQVLNDLSLSLNNPSIRDNLIIAGDFNYDIQKSDFTLNAPFAWHSLLFNSFTNCMRELNPHLDIPTFRRGSSIFSVLDYIYTGTAFRANIHSPEIQYLNKQWTDHALLCVTIKLVSSNNGKGFWRANPTLVTIKDFRQKFATMLTTLHPTLDPTCTPQQHWEFIKKHMVKFIKQYCRERGSWRQKQLKALQSKRNNFLRKQKSPVLRAQILPTIETQIATLQKEITDILAIRSGTTW